MGDTPRGGVGPQQTRSRHSSAAARRRSSSLPPALRSVQLAPQSRHAAGAAVAATRATTTRLASSSRRVARGTRAVRRWTRGTSLQATSSNYISSTLNEEMVFRGVGGRRTQQGGSGSGGGHSTWRVHGQPALAVHGQSLRLRRGMSRLILVPLKPAGLLLCGWTHGMKLANSTTGGDCDAEHP